MKPDSSTIIKRYNRLAPYYDGMEAVIEGLLFSRWRKRLWSKVEGEHILEVGVGTGKNFSYYPKNTRLTAIDFSPDMLALAQQKRVRKGIDVHLDLMDVEQLYYADNSFDTVVATFVFCSVAAPRRGLRELYRVCKPGGQVILLEHVLSSKPLLARMMHLLNPLVLAAVGANINRETIKNVQACGFNQVLVDARCGDIIKLIQAYK
ncbi:MAG: methyltransferase domain-containing protein [Methylococcales bacterium]|nr:methyltransferase domain-containing protein [Methylococcales bacterium]